MRRALAAACCAVLLLSTACTDDAEGDRMDLRQDQDSLLAERPSVEAAEARMTAARDAIRRALATGLGLTAWSEVDNADRAGCDDLSESSGETVYVPSLLLQGGVPDDVWPRAVEVVEQTATGFGFTQLDIVVDAPGQHEMVMTGEYDALLRFGSILDATLSLQTGCHLPAGGV